MSKLPVNTTKQVVPMIYAYTTPEIHRHDGWTKIGYTEQDVDKRLTQQTQTADIQYHEEWRGNAVYDDGTGERFTDKDFHKYLRKLGIENTPNTEWFHVTGPVSRNHFNDFRADHGIINSLNPLVPYKLRAEQEQAVSDTVAYRNIHEKGEFLWNAKPRFGKTLAAYDFCKRIHASTVLIVTNRPAIANSWYSDYETFLGTESGYRFVSRVDGIKDKPLVMSREEYLQALLRDEYNLIEFVSLQDLKGAIKLGGNFDKLGYVTEMDWDVLIIDEAHEGVDTYRTDVAFDKIKRKFTLHLSGTPFKALANDKFNDRAIFNWTYAEEQTAKKNWNSPDGDPNPYQNLPRLNLFTYQMSEIIRDEIDQGVEINGETEEYAFDLNEFFATNDAGRFIHDSAVDRFLDALTEQTKYPFSTEELRDELKHTFWLLNRVDSAKALARKLEKHSVFGSYHVVLAAGDGKMDDADETGKSFDKVKEAIRTYDKTITLSVGQLTTGVTIPEWTAVLMLSNVKSPSLYMQAAFRAQNPCLFKNGSQYYRKENAYVFDFDPARTLTIFEEFANDLYSDTVNGKGTVETRKKNVKELLNFFPVLGEDEDGEMIELDAEKVLTIPRKIKSQEVVRRGFMSNYLFQNIGNIFGAPQAVIDILDKMTPTKEGSVKPLPGEEEMSAVSVDENGDPNVSDDIVIGISDDVFGAKIYDDTQEAVQDAIDVVTQDPEQQKKDEAIEKLTTALKGTAVKEMMDSLDDHYGTELHTADRRRIEKKLERESERLVHRAMDDYSIETKTLEQEKKKSLADAMDDLKETEKIHAEFEQKKKEAADHLRENLTQMVDDFVQEQAMEIIKTAENTINERKENAIEDQIRDHLRGFTRTIPSFLMAYGDNKVTLATFDDIIPDKVFIEVTSITLEQFRFLRDGGKYIDDATGEEKEFKGNLFDSVVFDDSVQEFLALKKKLADYFDEKSIEDIFDYIPPQKTNQIYTPKKIVKKMVDMLEEENPGCFDNPDKTFVDLYMKSGLYITEVVKRLYQSEKMKQYFPNGEDRLRHIFEKQVYGLAPTEIIYRIATAYILGFDDEIHIEKHHLRLGDSLPHAKDGTLEAWLDQVFKD